MSERSSHAKQQAHERIATAVRAQTVRIGVNVGIANRPGSPVFIRRESAVPLFLSFFGVIAATLFGGPLLGVMALGLAGIVWIWLIHPRLRDRVYERAVAFATGGVAEFETMWNAGAISLQRGDGSDELRSPAGDWVAFGEALAA
jgi:hypothetical protein